MAGNTAVTPDSDAAGRESLAETATNALNNLTSAAKSAIDGITK